MTLSKQFPRKNKGKKFFIQVMGVPGHVDKLATSSLQVSLTLGANHKIKCNESYARACSGSHLGQCNMFNIGSVRRRGNHNNGADTPIEEVHRVFIW